jgi:hypothetical protein
LISRQVERIAPRFACNFNVPFECAGEIRGDTMTLTVTESDTKKVVGTFTLVFGQRPRVMKCR